jgi:glycerol-3-phosphate responsive antiterminator
VGGVDKLAERFHVSRVLVRAWMTGSVEPPPGIFFQIVDIIADEPPAHLIASGLIGEPTAPEIGNAGATNKNS